MAVINELSRAAFLDRFGADIHFCLAQKIKRGNRLECIVRGHMAVHKGNISFTSATFTNTIMTIGSKPLFVLLILLLSSCQFSTRLLTGMNTKKQFEMADVEKLYARSGIPKSQAYIARDTLFDLLVSRLESEEDPSLYLDIKNHHQPIQIIFPDDNADHIHYNNCSARGIRKLDYNHAGSFNQYPPQPCFEQSSLYSIDEYYENIVPVYPDLNGTLDLKKDRPILVLWSLNMRRHSKDMLEYFQEYFAAHNLEDSVIYVHNSFVYKLFNEL